MQNLAHVSVNDYGYCVHVSVCCETASIHIFKYNSERCEYDVFTDQLAAQLWLEQPLRP